jgi:hypothetical protein
MSLKSLSLSAGKSPSLFLFSTLNQGAFTSQRQVRGPEQCPDGPYASTKTCGISRATTCHGRSWENTYAQLTTCASISSKVAGAIRTMTRVSSFTIVLTAASCMKAAKERPPNRKMAWMVQGCGRLPVNGAALSCWRTEPDPCASSGPVSALRVSIADAACLALPRQFAKKPAWFLARARPLPPITQFSFADRRARKLRSGSLRRGLALATFRAFATWQRCSSSCTLKLTKGK